MWVITQVKRGQSTYSDVEAGQDFLEEHVCFLIFVKAKSKHMSLLQNRTFFKLPATL